MADGRAAGEAAAASAVAGASASPSVAQQSASEQQTTGWYYLDNQGQHVGPFTTQQLQGRACSWLMAP